MIRLAEFFELDPLTGIKTETAWDDQEGTLTIIRTGDCEPYLQNALEHRNEVGPDKQGIQEGWHHYAQLPPIVQLQMMDKGIDITRQEHQPYMFREINEHYPHTKMTTGTEGKTSAPVYFMPKPSANRS